MAAAPLRHIVSGEALGAMLIGAGVVLWTGPAIDQLGLPNAPTSSSTVRLAGLVLLGFGVLLWSVREQVLQDTTILRGLVISHGVAGAILLLQAIAIWNSRFGAAAALIPLALTFRYAQYLYQSTSRPSVRPASTERST